MKAHIEPSGRIAEIRTDTFPVHESLMWVDCTEDITTQHKFENGVFINPIPLVIVDDVTMPSLTEQIIANPTELAKLKTALGLT
jgi:hypothetical protein